MLRLFAVTTRYTQRCTALLLSTTLIFMPGLSASAQVQPSQPAAVTITVDTSTDPNPTSLSQTCANAADGKCTLRRALRQVAATPLADRPIEIRFNLASDDPNKDLEVAGTWTLSIDGALPDLLGGQVTIDGSTQPGGRTTGPAIVLNTKDNSLTIASEDNIIRNLSIKGGGVIFVKGDRNTLEKIWMGLTDDGQAIHFRTPGDEKRMAGGGIFITGSNNLVQDNVIAGAFAKAVDIGAGFQNNIIQRNLIGTRADGTVPPVAANSQCARSFGYDPDNWYGGWGIALSGSNNKVLQNRIAGLHILQSANDTPPMAMEIFGANHEISGNIIGVDSAGNKVGVCGQGIKVSGNGSKILDNHIVASRIGFEDIVPTAILASDTSPTFGRITVRGNLIENGPGNVYAFGPGIPKVLQDFAPARITNMQGATVSGSSGFGSPCPGCLIDLYRDDDDVVGETLAHLGSATADSNGNFTLVMTQTLPAGAGLRTSSTTQAANIISGFGAGTTTKFSKLYLPMNTLTVTGPLTGSVGISYTFAITVTPLGATTPFSYTVKASDVATQTLISTSPVLRASYTWVAPGVKTINVTVRNELGTLTAAHSIMLREEVAPAPKGVYLPLVQR